MIEPVPLYENDKDRAAEAEIVALACRRWHVSAIKQSMAYRLDYRLLRGNSVVAFAEAKDRDLTFGVPGGYYVSLAKAMTASSVTLTSKLPCLLIVRFSDGIVRWARFADAAGVIEHGRHDRPNDPNAFEPCMVFGWHLFQPLHDEDTEIHF